MKNRITGDRKKKFNIAELRTFFLACEFKPNTPLFSVLDPFAYDVQPAFIYGSLGIISYNPVAYSIIDIDEGGQPLIGYIVTITEPSTVTLLEKIKGYHGLDSFNTHQKIIVQAFTDVEESQPAWAFQLNDSVLENYQQVHQIDLGLWQEDDEELMAFLEKISEGL